VFGRGTATILRIRKVDKEYWKKLEAVLPLVADDGKTCGKDTVIKW
jgi:hypothetical protein